MKTQFLLSMALFFVFFSCKQANTEPLGDRTIHVFEDTNLYFDMAFKSGPSPIQDSILRLDAGRVILKKVTVPSYVLHTKATVNVSLTSHGDPWDKSGSLFVIPTDTDISLLDFENSNYELSQL